METWRKKDSLQKKTPSISLYAPSVYVDQLKHLMAEGDQSLSVYVCESGTCLLCVHNSLLVCLHIPATTSNLLWLITSEKVWTWPILHSTENPIHVFPEINYSASFPIPTFMYL